MTIEFLPVDQQILYIKEFVDKGGPNEDEYEELNEFIHQIGENIFNQKYSFDEISSLRKAFGRSFSSETIQGHAFQKPHGYAGDFEMLDRLHTNYVNPDSELTRWDKFTQNQTAVNSVRNRKEYFKELLKESIENHEGTLTVLNVASGSCRDIYEFFQTNPDADVMIDCLEQDKKAISYAQELLKDHLDKVNFISANILRYHSKKRYGLIWSAGLFDYFEDRYFISVLNRMLKWVETDGELVIGNFNIYNPTRNYMILLNWILFHRSKRDLVQLARACGVPSGNIKIDQEDNGVNLFMHVKC